MISNLNLKINNIGPIKNADIDIGKINVIGGLNATGKSTASKLLYCVLKSNIVNRQEFGYSLISNSITSILSSKGYSLRDIFDISIEDLLKEYENMKMSYFDGDAKINSISESNFNEIEKVDNILEIIDENDNDLYEFLLKSLLTSEFSSFDFNGNLGISGEYNNKLFNFNCELENNTIKNRFLEGFFSINDIFYIDSFSVLDTKNFLFNSGKNERSNNLLKSLDENSNEEPELFGDDFNNKIIATEQKVADVIKGNFSFEDKKLSFTDNNGHKTYVEDTSSGIKQIGIIQLLLAFRKLKENSFLIIDEPEVNLHPTWQINLAEILTILAKDLNIHIYINTHSPMFIEAMSVYAEYYELLDETYFYLTEKHEEEGFYFRKIAHNNMGAVYQNLAKPYEILDKIKAKLSLRL